MTDRRRSETESREAGWEKRDASVGGLLAAAAVVALLIAAPMLVLSWFDRRETGVVEDAQTLEAAANPSVIHWSEARELLQARRALAIERLSDMSWVDRDAGIARIPIEEAMRLIARQGSAPAGAGGAP